LTSGDDGGFAVAILDRAYGQVGRGEGRAAGGVEVERGTGDVKGVCDPIRERVTFGREIAVAKVVLAMTGRSDARKHKAWKRTHVSKGFYVRSSSERADFTSSVIDPRVEEREERLFNQPTGAGGHGKGVFGADAELDVIKQLGILEEGTGRVGDCATVNGQRVLVGGGGNADLRQTVDPLLGDMFECLLLARQKIPEGAVV
jgi:hypothetical protein